MFNEQLMYEMRTRAREDRLFHEWFMAVEPGTLDDDDVMGITMALCILLHDCAKKLQAELLEIHKNGLPDVVIDGQRIQHDEEIELDHIPAKPTGVAESMAFLHELNQAIVDAGAEEMVLASRTDEMYGTEFVDMLRGNHAISTTPTPAE